MSSENRNRGALLIAVLALMLFPYGWMARSVPAFGYWYYLASETEMGHLIAHFTAFVIIGAALLWCVPALRNRPASFIAIIFLCAIAQEGLQLAYKRRAIAYTDIHDVCVDLVAGTFVFVVWRVWSLLPSRTSAEDRL